MSPNYKLLAIDVDGTLIPDKDAIPPANIAAIKEAASAGVHVSLCTGRSTGSAKRFVDALAVEKNVHVFFDGALVARDHQSEPVYVGNMERALMREIVDYAEEHDIDIELASVDRYFARRDTWSTRTKRDFFDIETVICPLLDVCDAEKIIRGDIVIRTEEEDRSAGIFREFFTGRVQFSEAYSPRYPGVRFLNIIAAGLTKGKALTELASHLGIDMKEVMAVGDWLNDIPMLEVSGLGVAMGNAHEDVKKAADAVTLSVEEDGLAAAVRQYLL